MNIKNLSTSDVIKELRHENKLTQEKMGNILGVKKSAVQKYEDGTIKNLKLDTIRTICETFGVAPWRLVFPDKTRDWVVNLEQKKESQKELIEIAIKKEYNEKCYKAVKLFMQMNNKGMNKTLDYMNELLEIEKYQNKNKTP